MLNARKIAWQAFSLLKCRGRVLSRLAGSALDSPVQRDCFASSSRLMFFERDVLDKGGQSGHALAAIPLLQKDCFR
eukprot:3541445-Amphidinium_carterae.1